MCCLIQASPHSLLIVFRNLAGDFLDLVKYDSETAGSQACRRCELRAAVSVFTGGKITMYYIGVDLGTSAVKLLLMEGSGKICNIVSKEYPLFFPHPGWSEQNPEDWFTQSIEGIKELTEGIDRKEVAGIGFGGQMHGLVTLDKDDNVIRPAILWNDGRTGEETEYLNTVIGKEKLSQYTANIAFAGFTAPKILWMQKHEPENFKKVVKIMLPKDYLAYRLSGSFCTDVSDASGMLLLDVKNRCWSKEMLEICHITEEQLPKLYESWQVVGNLKAEVAKELGFSEDVKVVAGAGDNAAAAVGTGTVGDGQCNISLGTSGTIFISSKDFGVDENNALHSFDHADGSYHLMGCMLSAASCNKWWSEEILKTKDFVAEQAPIQKLGENQVFFLPYLMGERSPHNNPDARGVFFGMSMDTTRADMTQAVLEGVAFGLRDSLEVARSLGIHIERTKICGGGAKSPLWKKIIANVMNLKVDVPENEEGPSMGGAMLAAVGCGEYPDVETICNKLVRVVDTVEPEPELVAKYEEKYRKFRKLYPAMKELFR
jgi:xylulokinase